MLSDSVEAALLSTMALSMAVAWKTLLATSEYILAISSFLQNVVANEVCFNHNCAFSADSEKPFIKRWSHHTVGLSRVAFLSHENIITNKRLMTDIAPNASNVCSCTCVWNLRPIYHALLYVSIALRRRAHQTVDAIVQRSFALFIYRSTYQYRWASSLSVSTKRRTFPERRQSLRWWTTYSIASKKIFTLSSRRP